MFDGLMMDFPLLLGHIARRAERNFADRPAIELRSGTIRSRPYAEVIGRARRLAGALRALGVEPGDRVGSLAWNTLGHLESYYAVPCMGAILHTINFRLRDELLEYTIAHGGAEVLLVEGQVLESVIPVLERSSTVRHIVVLDGEWPHDRIGGVQVHSHETLLAGAEPIEFDEFPERRGAVLCYTSATTGDPKGVLYSHRSIVLHAMQASVHGAFGIRESMRLAAIAPMFHANGWNLPYAALLQGATLLLPGGPPEPAAIADLVHQGGATHLAAAVTVGAMLRDHAVAAGRIADLSTLEELWLGGQAPPPALTHWFSSHLGASVFQGWGMTETAVITYNRPQRYGSDTDDADPARAVAKQGYPLPLAEIDIVDDSGAFLPWDGRSIGEYVSRGPGIANGYFRQPERTDHLVGGWLRSGDLGVIDPSGGLRLMDRTKDVIKSGGEWISSVAVENHVTSHPGVALCAVVGRPDEKWVERPVAWVVPSDPSSPPSADELRALVAERFERWWVPDDFRFVAELPRTGVGKIDKRALRAMSAPEKP